jgi:hypothetical protein
MVFQSDWEHARTSPGDWRATTRTKADAPILLKKDTPPCRRVSSTCRYRHRSQNEQGAK